MLLDTASLYFRAFFGVPDTRKSAQAPPTNAASGLLDMIARLIREHRPCALVACWDDAWRPAWRVQLIPSYKQHRVASGDEEEMPPALREQIPLIEALLVGLGLPPVGVPDHEADDVIGTYASTADVPVDVVTGDRDLFQLIDDDAGVRVLYTARGIAKLQFVDAGFVAAKYGVSPAQYADMATLRGDASDGLPGVAGIGEKTAASLLRLYGDLTGVRAAAADPSSGMAARARASLLASTDYLDKAPAVVRVARDLPVPPAPTALPVPDVALLDAIGREFGIASSVTRVLATIRDQTSEE